MVLQLLTRLLVDRFGCDAEDVTMAASLDDLNITEAERCETAMWLWERFIDTPAPDDFPPMETVEDMVALIEDRLG